MIKAADVFLLSEQNGEIPVGNEDGFGLYYHDCRYLDGYSLQFSRTTPNILVASAHGGSIAEFELTNENLMRGDNQAVAAQTFGISLRRIIDGNHLTVHDVITIANYDVRAHELPLSLSFHSKFEDIFEIRGLHPKKIGKANDPKWHDGGLVLSYSGADGIERRLEVHFDPSPQQSMQNTAEYLLTLQAGERQQLEETSEPIDHEAAAEGHELSRRQQEGGNERTRRQFRALISRDRDASALDECGRELAQGGNGI